MPFKVAIAQNVEQKGRNFHADRPGAAPDAAEYSRRQGDLLRKLPLDVFTQAIAPHMATTDLVNLRATNRAYRSLIDSDTLLNKRIAAARSENWHTRRPQIMENFNAGIRDAIVAANYSTKGLIPRVERELQAVFYRYKLAVQPDYQPNTLERNACKMLRTQRSAFEEAARHSADQGRTSALTGTGLAVISCASAFGYIGERPVYHNLSGYRHISERRSYPDPDAAALGPMLSYSTGAGAIASFAMSYFCLRNYRSATKLVAAYTKILKSSSLRTLSQESEPD